MDLVLGFVEADLLEDLYLGRIVVWVPDSKLFASNVKYLVGTLLEVQTFGVADLGGNTSAGVILVGNVGDVMFP